MNDQNNTNHVETLIKKAADANTADDAMKFSQAATNAGNAMCALKIAQEK